LPLISPYSTQIWLNDDMFLTVIFFCNIILSLPHKKFFRLTKHKYILKKKIVAPSFIILSIYFFYFSILKLSQNNFNLIQILIQDRVEEYLDNAEGFNDLLMRINYFLQILYFVFMFYYATKKRYLFSLFGFLNILLFIILYTHTRFILLSYLVIPIIYYNSYHKKISKKTIIILIVIAGLFLSVTNFIRTGAVDSISFDNPTKLVLTQVEIESVEDFYHIYSKVNDGQIDYDYGIQYLYYLPITFIPRYIWPEKPIVSYFWRLTKEVSGSYPGRNNFVLTSTIFGEAYHQGGLLGIFIFLSLYFIVANTYINYISNYQYFDPFIWFFLIHVPMDFRGALSSLIPTIVFTFLVILLISKFTHIKIHK
jgi:oligosaccharide repeat unit polymerase